MVRVAVLYPRTSGKKFDFEYYKNKHMKLVKERLKPLSIQIDIGVPNARGENSPYVAIGFMTFESMEHMTARYRAVANDLVADIPNYTDIEPVRQISEVVTI
jgi:uncharacterized protein (TIGR02118 family)